MAANSHDLKIKTGPKDSEMSHARVCYDHLAGYLSVELFDKILADGHISLIDDQVALTAKGTRFFNDLGFDVTLLHKAKRPTCRSCLDWSERRFHLAGGLGASILSKILDSGWAYRVEDSRIIKFTPNGMRLMGDAFGIKF